MSYNNESTFEETSKLFSSECGKLQTYIENALEKSEKLSNREIVEVYYQIMNVNSLAEFLKQHLSGIENSNKLTEEQKTLLEKIKENEQLVSEKFNANLHSLIKSQLTNSIAESMNSLKSTKKGIHGKKPKNVIEQDAQLYERLREMMSTKEFVDQYDKGLGHD